MAEKKDKLDDFQAAPDNHDAAYRQWEVAVVAFRLLATVYGREKINQALDLAEDVKP